MKRNKFICVRSSVNVNPAENFNEFAQNIRPVDDFERLINELKESLAESRTKWMMNHLALAVALRNTATGIYAPNV